MQRAPMMGVCTTVGHAPPPLFFYLSSYIFNFIFRFDSSAYTQAEHIYLHMIVPQARVNPYGYMRVQLVCVCGALKPKKGTG